VEDRETFRALKAPVRRVCAAPVPVPYSPPLEQAALPSRHDIKAAVYDVLKESVRHQTTTRR
jgi:pyruvate dehydrogenase E1 component beta subunit